ncbi:hypothetical protein Taro_049491 [Colocasia esculenta]|uniref:Glutamate receptor n=1 Tax=Colocasia esculenta TaxID=4460 RepID=A0A843XB58_COLES|nr:hypothetical protein [Colocasia esculenta]
MACYVGRVLLPSASLFLFLLSSSAPTGATAGGGGASAAQRIPFRVGVILDRSNWNGNISWTCISMAVEDFYAAHPKYRTRVELRLRDSGEDTVGASSAALDLLKNVQVQAIIGPMRSAQAAFVMELGHRGQVPVISFSDTSPSLSSTSTKYFIRTAINDKSQAQAIAAIVQTFKWREVIPILEDTEYGRGIEPDLIDELREVDVHVPYRSVIPLTATEDQILSKLKNLKTMQTRIFVVHTTCQLGFRVFSMARKAKMMQKGYVWITTYGLTDLQDLMGPNATDVMQGVLGVKPHVKKTPRLKEFKVRWRTKFQQENPSSAPPNEPTVFGLWAYDTVWALAIAAERVRTVNFAYQNVSRNSNSTDFEGLGLSPIGPELLSSILSTECDALSGNFQLVISQQLDNTTIEIVNVVDNRKIPIGFWTASQGVSRHLKSKADLKIVTWPGKSTGVPSGWKKLRIGVPSNPGFGEFVDLDRGFCIRVFNTVMEALPYRAPRFEYVLYAVANGNGINGSYDELVQQVYNKNFDAVVGDVTIIYNRTKYVDFTLPFMESGVRMVVPINYDHPKNAWTFTAPLSGDLWLASGCFFIFTGERLVSNLSRFVMIIWLFVVLILTSSYTASLSSMLTIQQLRPTVTELSDLVRSGDHHVGHLNGSFVRGLLQGLGFKESKLKAYTSPEEYADALDKGSANGGVSAIFDELPYIKVLLSKYCGKYIMVGRTYKTDGFGFVFPKGSPLVPDVSSAIMNVTQGELFEEFEKKLYGEHQCSDKSNNIASSNLRLESFWGLFLIAGVVSTFALILCLVVFFHKNRHVFGTPSSHSSVLQKLRTLMSLFDQKDPSSHAFKHENKDVEMAADAELPTRSSYLFDQPRSPSSISNHTYGNFEADEGTEVSPEGENC